MNLKSILASVAMTAAMTTAASAVDLTVPYTDPGFDWDGFYLGFQGGPSIYDGDPYLNGYGVAGVIFTLTEDFAVALEGAGGSWMEFGGSSTGYWIEGSARFGYVMDDTMLYALTGVLTDSGNPLSPVFGGGIWHAFTDNVSVRGEVFVVSHEFDFSDNEVGVRGGAFWHFN